MASFIHNFLITRKELIRNPNLPISDSYVGLIWFSDGYLDIIETKGEVKFDIDDINNKHTIIPDGTHASFKTKRFTTPRARVELNNGKLTISTGELCPSEAIVNIINIMGLTQFKNEINIRRNSFWDKK